MFAFLTKSELASVLHTTFQRWSHNPSLPHSHPLRNTQNVQAAWTSHQLIADVVLLKVKGCVEFASCLIFRFVSIFLPFPWSVWCVDCGYALHFHWNSVRTLVAPLEMVKQNNIKPCQTCFSPVRMSTSTSEMQTAQML